MDPDARDSCIRDRGCSGTHRDAKTQAGMAPGPKNKTLPLSRPTARQALSAALAPACGRLWLPLRRPLPPLPLTHCLRNWKGHLVSLWHCPPLTPFHVCHAVAAARPVQFMLDRKQVRPGRADALLKVNNHLTWGCRGGCQQRLRRGRRRTARTAVAVRAAAAVAGWAALVALVGHACGLAHRTVEQAPTRVCPRGSGDFSRPVQHAGSGLPEQLRPLRQVRWDKARKPCLVPACVFLQQDGIRMRLRTPCMTIVVGRQLPPPICMPTSNTAENPRPLQTQWVSIHLLLTGLSPAQVRFLVQRLRERIPKPRSSPGRRRLAGSRKSRIELGLQRDDPVQLSTMPYIMKTCCRGCELEY